MSALNVMLRELARAEGVTLSDLTVLSPANDPFRIDTAGNREAGKWLRDQMEAPEIRGRRLHNRGLHYAITSRGNARFPSGEPYINDADGWAFLERASGAARWLGYVAFDAISDARNSVPIIRSEIGDSLEFRLNFPHGKSISD
jgi:hypothetical protein